MSGADMIARGLASQANAILQAAGAMPPPLALIERLNREGDPISTTAFSSYSSFPAPTGAGIPAGFGMPALAPGRAHYIGHVNFWATTPINGRLQVGQSSWTTGIGTSPYLDIGFACGPAYAASFPVNAFIRSSDKASMAAFIKQWLDPAVSGTQYFGAGAVGYQLADSINFGARKVILFLGDSIWNGAGPSSVQTCIPWLVNKFYRDRGIDCRYILKAYSGSTSSGHESYRQGGKYDFDQADLIFYNPGMNDALQAYATATSMANVQALIAWKQKRYPKARLVICGPTPAQAAATEGALASLRSAEQAYVAGLGDPRVLFCDLGNSFDRATAANYASSDGVGTGIHPVDAALTLEWSGGHNGNDGLKAWLAANLPTF